jgi:hypothetical protein
VVRAARRSGVFGIPSAAVSDGAAPARPGTGVPAPSDLRAALADVVGMEPTPTRPDAQCRVALPGLGPLSQFRQVVVRMVLEARADRVPIERVTGELERQIRHLLPSDTPDWSAHLLLEEVARWSRDAYLHGGQDGQAA